MTAPLTDAQVIALTELRDWFRNACHHNAAWAQGNADAIDAALQRLQDDASELETLRLQLAACGVAAMQNTRVTIANHRLDRDNPYWCASYGDVCDAVDREVALREQIESLQRLQGWQPIETCPREPWPVKYLVVLPDCDPLTAWWTEHYGTPREWCWCDYQGKLAADEQPTHWQPLPAPPAPGSARPTEDT